MFFVGRESQGAQGPVYPCPMYDTLIGKKVDKTYTVVYLENEYLRIGVLPEIGGRIFEGVDKTNNYNFIYRQHVINANENYQVIFPPSTQYGVYHGKREFTAWPFSTTRYSDADFTKGVDISWYKNHSSPNSVFAWNYQDDLFAGYDHGKEAGTMSVADHNIVPGKKFWTWGNGPSGRTWDKTLIDDDGPYIELMLGAYSDNQPDYSWLQPYETRSFSMNWYPFRDIGGVKKANLDTAVNLEVANGSAKVGFYTTSPHPAAQVRLQAGDKTLLLETVAINPAKPYVKQIAVPAGIDEHDLVASISEQGRELVSNRPIRLTPEPMPKPVTAPAPPQEIKTNEELYLIGLRAQQFHDPAIDPLLYWEEALRRDPGDARVNTALGITSFQKARYAEAEKHLRTALDRLTDRYTTPKDAEATYYLGATLKAEGRSDEAYAYFYKATWGQPWKAAGSFEEPGGGPDARFDDEPSSGSGPGDRSGIPERRSLAGRHGCAIGNDNCGAGQI